MIHDILLFKNWTKSGPREGLFFKIFLRGACPQTSLENLHVLHAGHASA